MSGEGDERFVERRLFYRFSQRVRIRYSFPFREEGYESYITEIGLGGIRFESTVHIEPGTLLTITISFEGMEDVRALVKAVWCQEEGGGYLVGAEFYPLYEEVIKGVYSAIEKSRGITFVDAITLKGHEKGVFMPERMEEEGRPPPSEEFPPLVFVVDDEKFIQVILEKVLTKAGMTVRTFDSAEEALDGYEKESPDVIITDVRMPGMSGIELLKSIKGRDEFIEVIIMTSFAEFSTAISAVKEKAFDFIMKPFENVAILPQIVGHAVEKRRLVLDRIRLLNELELKNAQLSDYSRNLKEMVNIRTRELDLAYSTLKDYNLNTVLALAETIEAKDPYTKGHCRRTSTISLKLLHALNMNDAKTIEIMEYGTFLHDIGKIGIADAILNKPSRLSAVEYEIVKEHPVRGEKIIKGIPFFKPMLPVVRNHHERFDGKGYPDRLKGEDIPFLARVTAIADAFEAMTSERAYRGAMKREVAVEEMKSHSGTQFDPEILGVFVEKGLYLSD